MVQTKPPSTIQSTNTLTASVDQDAQSSLSVSTTFYLGAELATAPARRPDIIIHSIPDSVFFYVHRETLLKHSDNYFGGHLHTQNDHFAQLPSPVTVTPPESSLDGPAGTIILNQSLEHIADKTLITDNTPSLISLPESADVLNVELHVLYDLPCERYHPTLETFRGALLALAAHGVAISSVITPVCEFTHLFLERAAADPLDAYSIASFVSLDHLAVSASRYTLRASLADLDDDACALMGPVYLRRLIFLHLGRAEALKRLLSVQLPTHVPTPGCNEAQQRNILRAWGLATAYLAWEARADLPDVTITTSLMPLVGNINCPTCENSMLQQIANVRNGWSEIKKTI